MLNPIAGMAVNPAKSNIYFTEYDANAPTGMSGLVQKAGKAKESPQSAIARNQVAPGSIAVDATKVFWAAECEINATTP
jgi:sugar lactone lactonase YvrE